MAIFFIMVGILGGCAVGFGLVSVLDSFFEWKGK